MTLAVPHVVRNWQMQEALAYGFPRLEQQPDREGALQIVGYGPSILATWRKLDDGPVLSLSGAHDFLIQRGIYPTWHADCDPRVHKSSFVAHPSPGTTYLMATCCHPKTWEYLLKSRVLLWHADCGEETLRWLAENDEGWWAIRPGPSIGTAALELARLLGFKRVRLFGYDSCFVDEALNAGPSERPYTGEQPQVVEVDGVPYLTTENMRRQAYEFRNYARGLEFEIVGEGLLKAMLREKETA